jgi:hypothetical protein
MFDELKKELLGKGWIEYKDYIINDDDIFYYYLLSHNIDLLEFLLEKNYDVWINNGIAFLKKKTK